MKRRAFIENMSIAAFSISAFGFIKWDGEHFVGSTPTTTDILGPFYRPGAPIRSNIVPAGSKGILVNLNGAIYRDDGITPLKGALVEIWQCDAERHYDNTSPDYLFRGALITAQDGRYAFKTVVPVPYMKNPNDDPNDPGSWRPAHIHMRVHSDKEQDLVTQIYFKGDKYIKTDPWASASDSINRILTIAKNSDNENELQFNVVMSKTFSPSEGVYKEITGLYMMEQNNTFEFIQNDDLLFVKQNGQFMASLNYIGNNTFEGGGGGADTLKVSFELLPGCDVKATIIMIGYKTFTGKKYIKY